MREGNHFHELMALQLRQQKETFSAEVASLTEANEKEKKQLKEILQTIEGLTIRQAELENELQAEKTEVTSALSVFLFCFVFVCFHLIKLLCRFSGLSNR